MKEPTLSAFKESLNALLDSNPHAKSKGDVFKDWCVDCFGTDARISHIREQRQTTNRVSEQYRYFSPIVIFVIDPVVKRDVLEQYIVERGYRQLECVAIIGVTENAENSESKYNYTFEKLLVYRNSAFAKWATVYFDSINNMTSSACSFAHDSDLESLQVIYYGAPGTGKSHQTDKIVTDFPERHIRTIFHPDSDYSSFVGCYKPTQDDNNEHEILYKFIPQPFIEAYIEAWHDISKPFFLIIEEINRGNCAQIFGDIFQLLDRDLDRGGISKYAITPDSDLRKFLAKEFAKDEYIDVPDDIRSGHHMRLPGNLYILATMNTSDQSLFPIDSAFKRRWEWEYKPIEQPKDAQFCGWKIVTDDNSAYDWWNFLTEVNNRIFDTTQSEDKKMGYWFTKADAQKRISQKKFIGKVLFYLWNDIFKDYARTENTVFKVFKDADKKETEEYTFTDFFRSEGVTERVHRLMFTLGIEREQWIDDNSNEEDGEDLNELQRKVRVSKYYYILNGESFSGIGKAIIFIVNKLGENFTFDEIADTFNRIVKKTYKNESAIKAQLPSELNPDENGRNRWYVNPFKDKDGKQFSLISLWPDSYFKRIKEWVEFYPEIFPNGFEQVQNTNSID